MGCLEGLLQIICQILDIPNIRSFPPKPFAIIGLITGCAAGALWFISRFDGPMGTAGVIMSGISIVCLVIALLAWLYRKQK